MVPPEHSASGLRLLTRRPGFYLLCSWKYTPDRISRCTRRCRVSALLFLYGDGAGFNGSRPDIVARLVSPWSRCNSKRTSTSSTPITKWEILQNAGSRRA
jgi:hypothetical protein